MNKIIHTDNAPKAIGPYSQAIVTNGTLYMSGQLPVNPKTSKVVDGGVKEQTNQVLTNIKAILTEAGYQMSDVVKCTCLLSDMADFAAFNEVYAQYFTSNFPARMAFAVKTLPLNVMIEIDCIAVK